MLIIIALVFLISKCDNDDNDTSSGTTKNNQNTTRYQNNNNNNDYNNNNNDYNNNNNNNSNNNQTQGNADLDSALAQIKREMESILSTEYDSYQYKGYDKNTKNISYTAVKTSSVGTYTALVEMYTGLKQGKYEYTWYEVSKGSIYEVHNAAYPKVELNIAGTWTYKSGNKDFKVTVSDQYTANDYILKRKVEYSLTGYGNSSKKLVSDGKEVWYTGKATDISISSKVYLTDNVNLKKLRVYALKPSSPVSSSSSGMKIYIYLFNIDGHTAGLELDGCKLNRR